MYLPLLDSNLLSEEVVPEELKASLTNRDQNVCQGVFFKKKLLFLLEPWLTFMCEQWKCPQEISKTSEEAVDRLPVNWDFACALEAENNRWTLTNSGR